MGKGTGPEQWLITATMDGVSIGVWDTASGGGSTADTRGYRRGDGSLMDRGGPATFEDLTVSRIWDNEMDLNVRMTGLCGRAAVSVTKQQKDEDGAPFGRAKTYMGRLKGVTDPDANSNESGDAMFSFVVGVTSVQ